jgi:hypothetical protein
MKRRSIFLAIVLAQPGALPLAAQHLAPQYAEAAWPSSPPVGSAAALAPSHDSFRASLVHYGKWLTAAGAVALTVFAAKENQQSQRQWNSLLAICRSAQDACLLRPDGTYIRSDAEALYQLSRAHASKANQWLFAAQATLFATTALFIIDLNPGGGGPDNIPYPSEMRVGSVSGGTGVEMRLAF